MNNLPNGMIPDRDNVVYYDTEKSQFYLIRWEDSGNSDIPIRIYIPNTYEKSPKQNKKYTQGEWEYANRERN